MRYQVTAPVKGVNATVAGVLLADSVGETDSEAAVAYFRRHGYTVVPLAVPATEPAEEAPAELPARSASKSTWVAYATRAGMTADEADQLTRDQLAERYLGPKED